MKETEIIQKVLTDPQTNLPALEQYLTDLSGERGVQAAYNLLLRLEVASGLRRPTMAIFDHTFHLIGGGQKYGLTVAETLQQDFDITLIADKEISHQDIEGWYQLDLKECRLKIIKIPFYEEADTVHLDPARISRRMDNPFHLISKESGDYDFFINNSMNEMVYPLANRSFMICHFPERRPKSYFYADHYRVIYNSLYTAGWIEKKWKFSPHQHIYPPVDMEVYDSTTPKENIILSVARFETGGSKKQLDMARAFVGMGRRFPGIRSDWQLVLAGGSSGENPYLQKVREYLDQHREYRIELKINAAAEELKSLYRRAKIFWHLCGLGQTDPALVEHFGMTIVEAMQNRLAPIVFDGGGQQEIVEAGKSGFRVRSAGQLIDHTSRLIRQPEHLAKMAVGAYERSRVFDIRTFKETVRTFFLEALKDYKMEKD